MGTLKPHSNGLIYTSIWCLVHWPFMGGLLHLVQRGGAWAGWGPAQSSPRCTKYNSPPINGQCTNFILFDVAVSWPVPIKGLRGRMSRSPGLISLVHILRYSWCTDDHIFKSVPVKDHRRQVHNPNNVLWEHIFMCVFIFVLSVLSFFVFIFHIVWPCWRITVLMCRELTRDWVTAPSPSLAQDHHHHHQNFRLQSNITWLNYIRKCKNSSQYKQKLG